MSSYISERMRRDIYERAEGYCEYCRLHERYAGAKHEVDHILAEKHGGLTIEINLCLYYLLCNRNKGSDIASLDALSSELYPKNIVALFHPRLQEWSEHFQLKEGFIEPITAEGRVPLLCCVSTKLPDLNWVINSINWDAILTPSRFSQHRRDMDAALPVL